MSTVLKYRPEIDGLRAVAVLSVILFHAGVPGFSGGFVGVDVFFVISGYLITGILLREQQAGTFSIVSFYERRMRRILPALFLVLLASIIFGWFLLSPFAFGQFGRGLMAVTAFVSNILFRHTTNYFTATADDPLLHTWSLGVEEQFYIFFPLFLLLVWRYAKLRLWLWIVLAFVVSLGISQWAVQTGHLLAAFYLSPSRAFELLLGALVALAVFRGRIRPRPLPVEASLGWVGLGAIVWAVAAFDRTTPFPGWHALVPATGTAMILAFVRSDAWLGKLLSLRIFVGIGLVSYSAYLWHQPVFAFVHIAGVQPGLTGNLGLAGASLALAWLSWRYVERPFRDRTLMSRWVIFKLAAAASVLIFGFGAWLYMSGGAPGRFEPGELRWWSYADIDQQSDYVTKRFRSLNGKFTDGPKPKVLVLGDSYAQDFVNVVHESGSWQGAQIRTVYIPVICQMTKVDEDVSEYIFPANRPVCEREPSLRSSASLIGEADTVVLAASWAKWAAQRLPETIANLHLRPDQRLFVVGTKRFSRVDIRKFLSMSGTGRAEARHKVPDGVSEVNDIMKRELSSEIFVDQIHIVCGIEEQCPLVTDEDELISYDGGHLTRAGAKYIGERIFAQSALTGTLAPEPESLHRP